MRNVRVCTASMVPSGGKDVVKENREQAERVIDEVSTDEPDVIVLPEAFLQMGLPGEEAVARAEDLYGPTMEMITRKARQYGTYIVAPIHRREGTVVYNSSILVDRNGEVAGVYNKYQPTIGEIESGITPGRETPVFDTDFGRAGMAICFDLNFREVGEGLAAGRPDIIFFSSAYRGGAQLAIWALDFGVHVASSIRGVEGSCVVDPLGRLVKRTEIHARYVTAEINLDCAVLHIDYNNEKWTAIRERYGKEVDFHVASDEAVFVLSSRSEEVSVDDIIEQFELERREDYFARARRVRREALSSESEGRNA